MNHFNIAKNGEMTLLKTSSEVTFSSTDRSKVLVEEPSNNGLYTSISDFILASRDCDGKIKLYQTHVDDLPGFTHCLHIECVSSQGALGKNSSMNIQQRFSGKEVSKLRKGQEDALPLTVSFYAKASGPATYSIELFDENNRRHIVSLFSVRNQWERVVLTFPGDIEGKFDDQSERSMDMLLWLHSGSDFRGGTFKENVWHDEADRNRVVITDSILGAEGTHLSLTGLQIETGSTASPYQHDHFKTQNQAPDQYLKISKATHLERNKSLRKAIAKSKLRNRKIEVIYAFNDILKGLSLWRTWSMLAWRDNLLKYKRTVLGPFWLTANMLVLLSGMGLVFSTVLGVDIEKYLPYLGGGLIAWGLLLVVATESCEVFVQQQHVINSLNLPFFLHILRFIARVLFSFLHTAIVFIPLALFLNVNINFFTLLVIPGLILVLLNAIWASLILATLGSRYRDIGPIVGSVFQLMFFVTPIIWDRILLPGGNIWIDMNPLFHLVEVIRAPLLGGVPDVASYIWVTSMAAVGLTVSFICFSHYRRFIPYWL